MDSPQIYKVIGMMSGTSLDGLDLACCILKKNEKGWEFTIQQAITQKYSPSWVKKLSNAHTLSGQDLVSLDVEYGKFLGFACLDFIKKHKLNVDFIASHGHTVFHQPKNGFTFQLGSGIALYAASTFPVVYDFRSLDVALGGQGAPLVPIGDKLLFNEFDICLNLGGIANLSLEVKGKRIAYDICFVNMGLNYLATLAGKSYDRYGDMSSAGEVNKKMLERLTHVYNKLGPERPSLGREIFEKRIKPILDQDKIPLQDRLRTFIQSIALEIHHAVRKQKSQATVLCTGGGTFNSFLISTLLEVCGDDVTLIVPEEETIKFKEALIFAFLGVLRVRNEVNSLKSVTGAKVDSCCGSMVGFF